MSDLNQPGQVNNQSSNNDQMPPAYEHLEQQPFTAHVQPSVPTMSSANIQQPVIVQQPYVIFTRPILGRNSQMTSCLNCQAEVMTKVDHDSGIFTWLMCAALCLVGCDLGCCLIPFCLDSCKDTIHRCPNCNHMIGVKKMI